METNDLDPNPNNEITTCALSASSVTSGGDSATEAENAEKDEKASSASDAAPAVATSARAGGSVSAAIGRFLSSFSCTSARSAEDAIDQKNQPTELPLAKEEDVENDRKLTAEEADAEIANDNAASKAGSGGSSITGRILSFLHIGKSSTDSVAVGAPPIVSDDIDLYIRREDPNPRHTVIPSNSTDTVSSEFVGKDSNLNGGDGDHSM